MNAKELFADFENGFPRRKFSAGLLIAFIDFLKDLGVPSQGFKNLDDMLVKYPRQQTTAAGHHANTLIVARSGGTVSLRPFYNEAERFFRAEQKRFDYPSCAPHATQAWADYRRWLDALVTLSPKELDRLRAKVVKHVLLKLQSQEFDPASVQTDPPLFRIVLESFDITAHKGEPTGAGYQGIVFGFLRADNPHLQVEIDKVRTGSKRLQRVGDIDCWEGARLAISAEVKQFTLKSHAVPDLEAFANAAGKRGALSMVIALAFDNGVRDEIEALGLRALDRGDLLNIVQLWDPLKQRTAVQSLVYYVQHVEKNSSLTCRLKMFLKQAENTMEKVATPVDAVPVEDPNTAPATRGKKV
ncbi:MAG: hypothetical protein ACK5AZ_03065 [Bryobacteraceae bacterium]